VLTRTLTPRVFLTANVASGRHFKENVVHHQLDFRSVPSTKHVPSVATIRHVDGVTMDLKPVLESVWTVVIRGRKIKWNVRQITGTLLTAQVVSVMDTAAAITDQLVDRVQVISVDRTVISASRAFGAIH
jgi:hypothetical protein